jgi:hypothetical protein
MMLKTKFSEELPLWNKIIQEFHIRQTDGRTLSPDAEEHVKKCLEAAIERRSSKVLNILVFSSFHCQRCHMSHCKHLHKSLRILANPHHLRESDSCQLCVVSEHNLFSHVVDFCRA